MLVLIYGKSIWKCNSTGSRIYIQLLYSIEVIHQVSAE